MEQLPDTLQQGAVLRSGEVLVPAQQCSGGGLGLLQQLHIAGQIRNFQGRQAVLALAEEVAGATQVQVLLRNFKAVIGRRVSSLGCSDSRMQ